MPLGATTCAPARACATAVAAYRSSVASLSTAAESVSTPQCPWSVYSHRHRSAMTTASSPTSAVTSRRATWMMPPGSSAAEPRLSLTAGMPNRIRPPTPASAASAAALRRLSLVCWTTPGMEGTGTGSVIPSLTNIGSTRSLPRTLVCAARRRSAGVRRSLRGRTAGKPVTTTSFSAPGPGGSRLPWRSLTTVRPGLPYAAAAAAAALAWPAHRLTRGQCGVPQPRAVLGQRVHQRRCRRPGRGDVDAEPVLGGGLRGLRADHRHRGHRVWLAGDADEVPHGGGGGEQHGVEPAALDRLPDRGGRRRGAHRAVRGHVLGFPAQVGQPRHQGFRGDVRPGQEHPVDRVEDVVVGRPRGRQALAGLLGLWHQVGLDAEVTERRGRLLTYGG